MHLFESSPPSAVPTWAAVFIEKDGALTEPIPNCADPARVRLISGAGPALRALRDAGYRIVAVSNQPGVALGHFEEAALGCVRERLRWLLEMEGIALAGFSYCPHHPEGTLADLARVCRCRMPAPGLLRRASAELAVDLSCSWMIGATPGGVQAGAAAGCRTVLASDSHETDWRFLPAVELAPGLPTAAAHILATLPVTLTRAA